MKLKKLLSNIVASAMMLTTMAVSTVTASAANYIDIELNVSQDLLGAAIIRTNGDYSVAGETVTNESYWAQINRQDGGEDTKYAAAFGSSLVEGSKQSLTISADSAIGSVEFITVGWSNEYEKNVGHVFTVDLGNAVDNKLQVQLVPNGDVAEEQTNDWYYVQDVDVKYLAKVEAPDLTGYNAYDFAPASGSAEAWAQPAAVDIGGDNKITTKVLGGDFIIAVPYESASKPGLAFSDGSGDGALNWVKVNSCTVVDGVAYFKKADCTAEWTAAGGSEDFSELVKINVCAQADPLTVKDVKLYSTVSNKVVSPVTSIEAIADDSQVVLKWGAVEGAVKYKVMYRVNGTKEWTEKEVKDLTYTVTGLTNGTNYDFIVIASDGYTWSKWSEMDSITVSPFKLDDSDILVNPEITLTPGNGSIKIDWSPVSAATFYKVYSYGDGYFWEQGTTEETTFTVSNLVNGVEYGFFVQACNNYSFTNLDASAVKTAAPVYVALPEPEFTLTAGSGLVKIDWKAVEGAVGYNIYSYDSGYYWYQGSTEDLTYTVNGLWNDVEYFFLVQAYDANGSVSNAYWYMAKPVTPKALTAPEFTVTPGGGRVKLDWTAVEGATGYRIYSYDSGYFWEQGTTTDLTYTVNNLWNGTTYAFLVQSYNELSASNVYWFMAKEATPVALDAPSFNLVPGTDSVKIDWEEVKGATSYNIYSYNDGVFALLDSTAECTYTVENLVGGKEYSFLVQSVSELSQSDVYWYMIKTVSTESLPE